MNLLYDVAVAHSIDWQTLRENLVADPRIGDSHTKPIHVSGHEQDKTKQVRGAGGHCFIKDYEVFVRLYEESVQNENGLETLKSIRTYNTALLRSSEKDLDLLESVYGEQ